MRPGHVVPACALLFAFGVSSAHAHGTINALGQSAEHERLTRTATQCAPGIKPADAPGRCFESKSEDQLAGTSTTIAPHPPNKEAPLLGTLVRIAIPIWGLSSLEVGTIGAVGSPDIEGFFYDTPHCTAGDYFPDPKYPQTRAEADAALMRCHRALQRHFRAGLGIADGLVDANGKIIPKAVGIPCDPIDLGAARLGVRKYLSDVDAVIRKKKLSQRESDGLHNLVDALRLYINLSEHLYADEHETKETAKCRVIGELGRMMHGMQDFYSHGNWADHSDPSKPLSIHNPWGLGETGRAPLMDMLVDEPKIDQLLTTSCFSFIPHSGDCDGRIDHDIDMAKDKGKLGWTWNYPLPNLIKATDPQSPRGKVRVNFFDAARGAVNESTGAWTDFGNQLIARYGAKRGTAMICAITHDNPVVDCADGHATTGGGGSLINYSVTTPQNVDAFRIVLPSHKTIVGAVFPDAFGATGCSDNGNTEICSGSTAAKGTLLSGSFAHSGTLAASCKCIKVSFSSDQGQTWSPPKTLAGPAKRSAPGGDGPACSGGSFTSKPFTMTTDAGSDPTEYALPIPIPNSAFYVSPHSQGGCQHLPQKAAGDKAPLIDINLELHAADGRLLTWRSEYPPFPTGPEPDSGPSTLNSEAKYCDETRVDANGTPYVVHHCTVGDPQIGFEYPHQGFTPAGELTWNGRDFPTYWADVRVYNTDQPAGGVGAQVYLVVTWRLRPSQ